MSKPSLSRGTRDFGPAQMVKRNYIFDTIRSVFQRYGFLPIETPAIENLSVLMGKYGDEGDQLLFKILNSGNFAEGLTMKEITDTLKELMAFLAREKRWWLIPMVLVLVLFGVLIVVGNATGVGPFIYTLF